MEQAISFSNMSPKVMDFYLATGKLEYTLTNDYKSGLKHIDLATDQDRN